MLFPPNRPPAQMLMGTVFMSMGLVALLFPKTTARLSFSSSFLLSDIIKAPTQVTKKKKDDGDDAKDSKQVDIWSVPVSAPLSFALRCFGSQATLQGFLILTSVWTKETYRNFAIGILPFFVFDAMAWSYGYLTPFGAIGDAMLFPLGRPTEQVLIGTIYTAVGLTTLFFPTTISRLTFQPSFLSGPSPTKKDSNGTSSSSTAPITGASNLDLYPTDGSHYMNPPYQMSVQRFGAKAALLGLVILSAKFTPETYRNLGMAVLPFVAFDYLGWSTGAMSKLGAGADALHNALIGLCCYVGYTGYNVVLKR
ncbi:hypothetical protein HDV05_003478 [Chytridiales sp. JEL 0842]|nr:hypothetical protein HDV05_003478 [Chytridiales sp. JEL 0842]